MKYVFIDSPGRNLVIPTDKEGIMKYVFFNMWMTSLNDMPGCCPICTQEVPRQVGSQQSKLKSHFCPQVGHQVWWIDGEDLNDGA